MAESEKKPRLLHRKLFMRLTLPLVIALIMFVLLIGDLISGFLPAIDLLWLLPGIALGYPFGRLTGISWDSDTAQLVLDSGQGLILVGYLAVRFGASFLLNQEFAGLAYVGDIAMLVTIGLLIGRSLGLLREIRTELANHSS